MGKKLTHEIFLEKLKEKGIFYEFDYLSEYTFSKNKIKVRHKKCGHIFTPFASNHLTQGGCPKCTSRVDYTESFKEKSNLIHNNKYDYSLNKIIVHKEKVKIICPLHGLFWQNPADHLTGYGCKKCGYEIVSKENLKNPKGWRYTNWVKCAEKSKNFDSFKVYILKCWDENELFYKIGKTFTTVKKRFDSSELPYNWEIIQIFEGEGRYISELEEELKRKNKIFEYIPSKKFRGMYECFKHIKIW